MHLDSCNTSIRMLDPREKTLNGQSPGLWHVDRAAFIKPDVWSSNLVSNSSYLLRCSLLGLERLNSCGVCIYVLGMARSGLAPGLGVKELSNEKKMQG